MQGIAEGQELIIGHDTKNEGNEGAMKQSEGRLASVRNAVLYSGYGQLVVASYAAFANIGMWNALNTIGGLGTGDKSLGQVCMTILDGVALVAGFFAGSAVNFLGLRNTAVIGSIGCSVFIFCVFLLHFYNISHAMVYVVLAAIATGCVFTWLLAAVGSVAIHYATPAQRSIFLAIYSVVLNLGGILGSGISLGMSLSEGTAVNDAGAETAGLSKKNYIVILVVLFSGIPASMLLRKPEQVTRSDGSPSPQVMQTSLREEWRGIRAGLRETYLWLMLPIFMCSIYHEVSLFNYFNIGYFNVRSRAMNAVYYYAGRILASFPFQMACDLPRELPNRILAGLAFTVVLCCVAGTTAMMGLGNVYNVREASPQLDFTEGRSSFLAICFLTYGALETVASSFSLWLISSLPFNDAAMSNRYVGWGRVGAALGGFTPWLIESTGLIPDDFQWGISATLWVIAILCIYYMQFDIRRSQNMRTSEDDAAAKTAVSEGNV